MSKYNIIILGLAAAMALLPMGIYAAHEDSAGHYYEIPVQKIIRQQGSAGSLEETATTDTAQLLLYSRDNGTTAIQLKVMAGQKTVGFVIQRDQAPRAAGAAFGSVDEIVLPFQQPNRGIMFEQSYVADLLNENGQAPGLPIRLYDAAGNPAEDIQINYVVHSMFGKKESSGTARLMGDGKFLLPEPSFLSDRYYGSGRFQLTAVEPVTGMTMAINQQIGMGYSDGGASVTLPFLNDWSSSPTGVQKFSGHIYKDDGTPASHVKFRVMAPFYATGFGRPPQEFTAGAEGDFRLAYPAKPDLADERLALPGISLLVSGPGIGSVSSALEPGEDIKIRAHKKRSVAVNLLLKEGVPLDFSAMKQVINSGSDVVGFLSSTDPDAHNGAALRIKSDGSSGLEPVEIMVPAEYSASVGGYYFAPQKIEPEDSAVTFTAVLKDFAIEGQVVNLAGEPLQGAYILVEDNAPHLGNRMLTGLKGMKTLWEQTGGDVEKLGAYMARSDADGKFRISGSSTGSHARVSVTAPGFGQVSAPVSRAKRSARDEGQRLSGDFDVDTIALARQATVTLEVAVDKTTATEAMRMLHPFTSAAIKAGFLNNDELTTETGMYFSRGSVWNTNQQGGRAADDGQGTTPDGKLHQHIALTVPAETTFTLMLSTYPGPDTRREVKITEPLKADEIRDLGLVETTGKPPSQEP